MILPVLGLLLVAGLQTELVLQDAALALLVKLVLFVAVLGRLAVNGLDCLDNFCDANTMLSVLLNLGFNCDLFLYGILLHYSSEIASRSSLTPVIGLELTKTLYSV